MAPLKIDDLKQLSLNIGLCLVLLLLGAGLVFVAFQQESGTKKDAQQAAALKLEAATRLSKARDEAQEILDKTETYKALRNRGIIGQEHRLEWVEQLKNIQKERRLIDLQYEIAPQKPLEGEAARTGSGTYEVMTSPMKAQLQLLHEEDLLRFVEDLTQKVQAHIRVRRCLITRGPPSAGSNNGPAPQLSANCDIDWITLRERQ